MNYCPECGHEVKLVNHDVRPQGTFSYVTDFYKHDPAIHPDECAFVWCVEYDTMDHEKTMRSIQQ